MVELSFAVVYARAVTYETANGTKPHRARVGCYKPNNVRQKLIAL